MAPLVLELKKHKNLETVVCLTGQHREMLAQVMRVFGIKEDYNLDIMEENQTLTSITTAVLSKIEPVLNPDTNTYTNMVFYYFTVNNGTEDRV